MTTKPRNGAPPRNLLRNLPAFSPVAVKLMILVADENVSFKEVAKLFSVDPVLAGQILKLANSGLYGRGVVVQSVLQAVAMLGLKSISRIAVTAALTSGFPRPSRPGYEAGGGTASRRPSSPTRPAWGR